MELLYNLNLYHKTSSVPVRRQEGRRTCSLIIQDTDPDEHSRSDSRKPQGNENQQEPSACAPSCMEAKDHNKRDKEQGQLCCSEID